MQKIITIVGARPQFIKASALSRALAVEGIREIIVHTGQHFDDNMADIFFRQMEIPEPTYHLGIHSLSHGAMTGRMMEEIEKILLLENPDAVVVYGDTNSTLAGALAASKLHIPVAHVEAGLRSFNMKMPEEINRILTDRIATWLFCPTETAIENLNTEGFRHFPSHVLFTGDVMYDVALHYSQISAERSDILERLSLSGRKFILVTLHRQENTDDLDRLKEILGALEELSKTYRIVLPMHPRTRNILKDKDMIPGFPVIDPVGYFDMVELLKNCEFVITDSGGLQKEAFFFEKHCLVARDETEWIELVELGCNTLVGASKSAILENCLSISNQSERFKARPYGQGDAASQIARILKTAVKR